MRVTLKNVATAAGVTAGTVSRAINGSPKISEKTRLRVVQVAKDLGYSINLQARGLKTGYAASVGLVCASGPWILFHPYFAPMHAGFTTAAAREGVRVVYYVPPHDGKLELNAGNAWARELLSGQIDGCVIYQAQDLSKQSILDLLERNLAVVLMNTDEAIPGFFQILANTEQRIRESAAWAFEGGARRIGILGFCAWMENLNAMVRAAAASPRGLWSVDIHAIRHHDPNDTQALDAAIDAMMAEKPDAVVFNTEAQLIRFRMRQDSGSLPRDLGLFGFSGTHNSAPLSFHGVHYLETDLLGAGHQAYALYKEALERKPPRSERLQWRRRA